MTASDRKTWSVAAIKSLIDQNAAEHKTVSEDDSWHYEALERYILMTIFEYCHQLGIQIEGIDLRKLLDAEDDEDEGVPPEGVEPTLWALQDRMTDPKSLNPIPVPDEVVELFNYYSKTFWPSSVD